MSPNQLIPGGVQVLVFDLNYDYAKAVAAKYVKQGDVSNAPSIFNMSGTLALGFGAILLFVYLITLLIER